MAGNHHRIFFSILEVFEERTKQLPTCLPPLLACNKFILNSDIVQITIQNQGGILYCRQIRQMVDYETHTWRLSVPNILLPKGVRITSTSCHSQQKALYFTQILQLERRQSNVLCEGKSLNVSKILTKRHQKNNLVIMETIIKLEIEGRNQFLYLSK